MNMPITIIIIMHKWFEAPHPTHVPAATQPALSVHPQCKQYETLLLINTHDYNL
jgi:hypothetical protein